MAFPSYKETDRFSDLIEIDKEIWVLQKSLFDLRLKKMTAGTSTKPHLFIQVKRRISQLQFKKSLLKKLQK